MGLVPPPTLPPDYININLNTQKTCIINDQMQRKVAAALWKAAAAATVRRRRHIRPPTARLLHSSFHMTAFDSPIKDMALIGSVGC